MSKTYDLKGEKFGRLTVVDFYGIDKRGEKKWKCKCDCGGETIALSSNLRNGHTLSCGCYRHEQFIKTHTKHNETGTKLYTIWQAMKRRCYQKKCKDYKDYGDRGITVCAEWQDYIPFRDWALKNGYKNGLSIDRIDVNKSYCPNNCRWADKYQQANNKRNNVYLEYKGQKHTLKEWSRITGISYYTLRSRIRRKSTVEEILKEIK